MSEKKRKRLPDETHRPNKKVTSDASKTVKISIVDEDDGWSPVIVSTPGISLPPDISLKAYKKVAHKAQSGAILPPGYEAPTPQSELLLHSSTHPQITYTGREEVTSESTPLLKHYVGVYDPKTGELQLMEAKKLTIRATLRKEEEQVRKEEDEQMPSNQTARRNLGMEFGTKKAKKAIASQTENAISPSKPNRASPDAPLTHTKLNPATKAMLEAMEGTTDGMATRAELQAVVDDAKPRPKANLGAKTPADVYPIETLVGEETMAALTVKEWQDKVAAGEAVTGLKSRYVSQRLQKVATSGNGKVARLKVLRYLSLLLDFYFAVNVGAKGPKRVPQTVNLRNILGVQGSLVDGIKRRFALEPTLTKWQIDNLITHIAALSLLVDNFEVDVYDLKEDLKVDNRQIGQYYREIGCQVKPPTDMERTRMGMSKTEASVHKIARLKIPLDFPKQRIVSVKKR